MIVPENKNRDKELSPDQRGTNELAWNETRRYLNRVWSPGPRKRRRFDEQQVESWRMLKVETERNVITEDRKCVHRPTIIKEVR